VVTALLLSDSLRTLPSKDIETPAFRRSIWSASAAGIPDGCGSIDPPESARGKSPLLFPLQMEHLYHNRKM